MNTPKPSIGYWLVAAAEGRGLMTTALSRLIQQVFRTTALKKLYLYAGTTNQKSIRVAQRLGFVYQGERKGAKNLYGTLVDHAVFVKERLD